MTGNGLPRRERRPRVAWLAFCLIVLGRPATAQESRIPPGALSEDEIVALASSGLSEDELLQVVDRAVPAVLDAAALDRLRKAKVPASVVARFEPKSAKAAPATLQVDDVVNLVKTGLPDEQVVKAIVDSDSRFDLRVDDIVMLVRRGVPPPVIKVMRERTVVALQLETSLPALSLDDIGTLGAGGTPSEEILRRIRKADARFAVTPDDLIRLSRQKVPAEVLREVWARRDTAGAPPRDPRAGAEPRTDPAPRPEDHGAPPRGSATAKTLAMAIHREASGGFSLAVPEGWFLHRDTAGPNTLLSFTDREMPPDGGIPDAELQVFRYRSPTPERLTENNLEPIANNFLARLQANYAAKKMTLSYGRAKALPVSGRPGLVSRVASSAADGTTHEGEVVVTWAGDQVFVVSYAVRAEQTEGLSEHLATCVRSFTLESDRNVELSSGKPEEMLSSVFEAWKTAVRTCDFGVWRKIGATGCDTVEARRGFVDLATRLSGPDVRLSLGKIRAGATDGDIDCLVLTPAGSETVKLAFVKEGGVYRIRS